MKRLIKFQLIAAAVGISIGLMFDFLTIHPDALTAQERRAQGYFEIGTVYLTADDLK